MTDLTKYLVPQTATVLEAMSVIDAAGKGIAFAADGKKITGAVSDGDIRRYIIHGGDLSASVLSVARKDFKFLKEGDDVTSNVVEDIKIRYRSVPVLNDAGELVALVFSDETKYLEKPALHLPVVIMAGGKGTRLYPYTKVLPKPLIPIGDVPITMHIMQHFAKFGCSNFTMVVNHQKELIKAYYSDPELPYSVSFADETTPLGTAGGLKLLEGKIHETFFLTNCDILVDEDYTKIYAHHKKSGNIITMVCAVKNVTVPYGTITLNDDGRIGKMVEKPTVSYLVNTGYYVVEPEVLSMIPKDTFIHMPDIVQKCMDEGKPVGVFPISESQWSDMGQIDEMKKMEQKIYGK